MRTAHPSPTSSVTSSSPPPWPANVGSDPWDKLERVAEKGETAQKAKVGGGCLLPRSPAFQVISPRDVENDKNGGSKVTQQQRAQLVTGDWVGREAAGLTWNSPNDQLMSVHAATSTEQEPLPRHCSGLSLPTCAVGVRLTVTQARRPVGPVGSSVHTQGGQRWPRLFPAA